MSDTFDAAPNLAIFCDFENVAIGVRDANYQAFDIDMVIERLLDKGKIVVKKAYADWDRYKTSKRSMHEAAFEMIEIPHVSYSGKNSADIRMVVDALDLCYTKRHIDVFVVVSGDSDFSPLVSKLRENDKIVIGLGVKNSSSDLLIDNCDEFIYYDDLVRARRTAKGKKHSSRRPPPAERRGGEGRATEVRPNGARTSESRPSEPRPNEAKPVDAKVSEARPAEARPGDARGAETKSTEPKVSTDAEEGPAPEELEERRQEALDHVLDVIEALFEDRDTQLWGSMVKQTLKRKRPNFSERFHGYRTFSELLEDAQKRGLLELSKDQRSGGYIIMSFGPNA